jgi:hypothetical protein
MRRFIAAGMIVLGFISWGSAIGVTALLAMSKLPLYLAAALPFFGRVWLGTLGRSIPCE